MLHSLGNRQNMVLFLCRFFLAMMFLFLWVIVHVGDLPKVFAQTSGSPLNITAQQVQFDRVPEIFRATGSVVVTQGPLRLTADQATIQKLSGALIAKGKVHLIDQTTDVWAEEMEINVYTEAGIITGGRGCPGHHCW